MDMNIVLRVLQVIAYVLLGGFVFWFKTKSDLQNKAKELIDQAESMYIDTTKAGGKKFQWVVDTLMDIIPAPMRVIVTEDMVKTIVQNIFDAMKSFAQKTLNAAVDKYTE